MKERTYNVFLYVRDADGVVYEMGIVQHIQSGSDNRKLRRLQEWMNADHGNARLFPVPDWCITIDEANQAISGMLPFHTFAEFDHAMRMRFLEPMFQALGAPQNPLLVLTPIVDGVPVINAVTSI